ncbi:unnamed protein product [Medioppia subpectinata]|uniref:Uncharacterized protein n=1 Tax=Medioppia subpectinata TaxID=1979941 RepID=A0A7R9KPL4_9ACAR|nr:unnamed protein product [Medioppia subpectinata]CAG2107157.1 unnamed protein product [Medioppia subpectinata]
MKKETIEYQNYHNLKDQIKRALIEWELQIQSLANSEANSTAGDHKKRQLLAQIWDSERQMSADINSRQHQKDRERQTLLDSISQLDRHSAQLLDSIYNWDERHRNQVGALESAERQLLKRMLRYDKEVVLRKNAILIAMHEMLARESPQRALTDDFKEFNQLVIRVKINQQKTRPTVAARGAEYGALTPVAAVTSVLPQSVSHSYNAAALPSSHAYYANSTSSTSYYKSPWLEWGGEGVKKREDRHRQGGASDMGRYFIVRSREFGYSWSPQTSATQCVFSRSY